MRRLLAYLCFALAGALYVASSQRRDLPQRLRDRGAL
jgi:hypothetical protein